MANLTAKPTSLLNSLSAVVGIIERRQTLPILSNVILGTHDGVLSILGTDIEIQITSLAPDIATADFQPVTVNARKLLDILRTLPSDQDVRLQNQEKRFQVLSGKSRFTLQTLPPEDFPRFPAPTGDVVRFTITQGSLKKLISLVQYAMAQQDIRYYLNGLLLVLEEGKLKAIATDGHRLAYFSVPLAMEVQKQEIIIPRKTVTELSRLLQDNTTEVSVRFSATQVSFEFSSVQIVSKLIDGKFPDYTRVIPAQGRSQMVVARETLRHALSRVAILSNEKFRGVRWILEQNKLRIASSNADQEEAHEEIDVEYSGVSLDVGFNVNYLLDVLNNVSAERVECEFSDAASSVLMKFSGEDDLKYVVMPMRI